MANKLSRKKVSKPRKRRTVKPPVTVKKPVLNCHHPDVAHKVEEAFQVAGVPYYRFKKEFEMPVGRYKWVMHYLREVDLRIDLKTAKTYIESIKKHLNGGPKGIINIFEIVKILTAFESRLNLAFEPETVKWLASVTYFDDSEDLSGYDIEHARRKMQVWDEAGTLDFFLTNPIAELLSLKDISPESLQEYMTEAKKIIENPIFAPSESSEESL